MDKRKIILLIWLAAILVPINWIGRIAYYLRRGFWMALGFEPAHVIGHLILFGGLVFLLVHLFQLPLNRRSAIVLSLLVLALGVGQEIVQLQIKERGFGWPEIFDLVVDLTGGTLGWLAYRYFLRYRRYLQMAYFMLREA